ncbi:glutamine synthetase family protein [Actinocatenispora rupis]|uniref:Glutamine synthetase n=1 Tax=Actinocatenispora rupis TaxID=519421 RepID=A0A8J3NBY5_9ACTN|nr:glutamine synthetase family protein [Actinocatenispora rupis]GID11182.1 glutamine synthetase [Actinocatenispora rupis]
MDAAERAARGAQARQRAAALAGQGVEVVALTWVDTSGLTRVKAVPVERLEHAAAWGVGASPVFDTFLVDDSAVVGGYAGGPVGDLRLHPDLARLTVLAAHPGWAWAPADRYDQDGAPHPGDARDAARRAVARLAADGYEVRAAFEVEWCVSRGDGDGFVPAATGPAYGTGRLAGLADHLRDVVTALRAEGVAVEQIHPEYAAGQCEVSVAAGSPVAAADTAVLVRETVRAVAARAGLRVTYAPKVLADGVGNGGHVHLSLWRDGANLFAGGDRRYGTTAAGEAFAAGILDHLPALLALGAPSVASYLRLIPSHWAGAYRCWGRENREAALRLVTGAAGERHRAANIEVKCFDQAANPYLAVAGLLAAGHAGLAAGATLPAPVDVDPATLPAGTVEPLPRDLAAAVAAFGADPVPADALGAHLADTVTAVRLGEVALFADATADEVVARTRWRW